LVIVFHAKILDIKQEIVKPYAKNDYERGSHQTSRNKLVDNKIRDIDGFNNIKS
jgi:hypothetical protein